MIQAKKRRKPGKLKQRIRVGIIAPSSKVPEIEFEMGVKRIAGAGFEPIVHPHVLDGHLFFAGSDQVRAQALYGYALDSRFSILWSARGGYGSVRLLPLLERMTSERGIPPKKMLVGFSDSTALLEFVRSRWGWETLHAPMPGLRKFCELPDGEWNALLRMLRGESVSKPWGSGRLEFIGPPPRSAVEGRLVGGNLTVWASLAGTPFAGKPRGKILFFEDVDENLYRIDRMVQQLILAGGFEGAVAVVLGNFQGCRDTVPQVLAIRPDARNLRRLVRSPRPDELEPLRATMAQRDALVEIFAEVRRRCGIPVAMGLPCGHGPEKAPLPLGARYSLSGRGELKLISWDWVRKR